MKYCQQLQRWTVRITMAYVILLSGCVHIGETLGLIPEKPKVAFADFRIQKASFVNIDSEIDLKVLNQDTKDLKIDTIIFDLRFSDKTIGSGKSAQPISIKPNEEQTVRFPISLKTSELMGAAMEIMKDGAKDKLAIQGSANLDTWLGTVHVPFNHKISPR
jgi:LEA14-like dessication related protein